MQADFEIQVKSDVVFELTFRLCNIHLVNVFFSMLDKE